LRVLLKSKGEFLFLVNMRFSPVTQQMKEGSLEEELRRISTRKSHYHKGLQLAELSLHGLLIPARWARK
jgi:hypothetical protein